MDFVHPSRPVRASLLAGRGHYESVVQAVMRARRSVWIATANLKELYVEDHDARPGRRRAGKAAYRSIMEVFDELASRGVELRILHARYPSTAFRDEFDRHPRLVRGGLELRTCPRVHMKAVIVDASLLYLGSANWTGAGLGARGLGKRNFEVGIVTDDEAWIDDVQAMFDEIWSGGRCRTCRLRECCEAPLDLTTPLRTT
jgi:phosphatidylserine/phosphatidylglycerophosphate/cardiolipin synthase-like enzyme